ncbi:MAG TPA: S1 RNA-binding domain-containing protein, partial [Vicinamibacteria bacterium]
KPGDEIEVKVLEVDESKGKISLGRKQLVADPWTTVAPTFEVGQVVKGQVTRLADFGAFIEIAPGVEALAHASTFPPSGKPDAWKQVAPVGARLPVEILSIDLDRRRIGVTVVEETEDIREYLERESGSRSSGMGSLAEKLRKAMEKPR